MKLILLHCLYNFPNTNFFLSACDFFQLNVCKIIPCLWSSSSVFHLLITIVKCTIQSRPPWEIVIYGCHRLLYCVSLIPICIRYTNCATLALNQSISKFWDSPILWLTSVVFYDNPVHSWSLNVFQMPVLRKIVLYWIFYLYSSFEWAGGLLTFFLLFRQNTNQQ